MMENEDELDIPDNFCPVCGQTSLDPEGAVMHDRQFSIELSIRLPEGMHYQFPINIGISSSALRRLDPHFPLISVGGSPYQLAHAAIEDRTSNPIFLSDCAYPPASRQIINGSVDITSNVTIGP